MTAAGRFEPGGLKALAGVWIATLFSPTPLIGIFPLILGPVAADLKIGRGEASILITLFVVVNAFATPVLGRLADRRGARPVALLAIAALAAVALALGLCPISMAPIYALTALMGAFSPMVVINSRVVAGWFGPRRGLALSTVMIATAVLTSAFMQLNRRLLDAFGWQAVFLGLAALAVFVGLPLAALLYREKPAAALQAGAAAPPFGMPASQARMTATFWMLVAVTSLAVTVSLGAQSHLVAHLTDRGLTRAMAVNVLSAAALVSLVIQPLNGFLLDRFNSPKVALPYLGLGLVGVVLLGFGSGQAALVAGAMLMMAGAGGELGMMPYMLTRFFGLRSFSELYGAYYLIGSLGMAAAPVFMGLCFDRLGSYAVAFTAFSGFLLAAIILVLALPDYRYAPTER